jgi:hypothetical protein
MRCLEQADLRYEFRRVPDITEQQLRGAPAFSRDSTYDWNDRNRERELHDYYGAPYYWDRKPVTAV